MKVLLTGASGFLGKYVLRALQRQDIPAVALGRTRPHGLAPASFIAADLLTTDDFPALTRAAGATHLLHLAWVTEHGSYWNSALNFRWVDATTRLVQAFCASGGAHVVVAGTCAEYEWSQGRCHENETPLIPATLYGVAKDASRRLVVALCASYGARCAWGRVFFPFGVGEAAQRLVPALVAALLGQSAPFGVSAQARRDFLYAGDVADGLLALLQSDTSGGINISSGTPTPIAEIVCLLGQLLNKDPQVVLALPAQRADDVALLFGENSRLKALGWRQQFTLERGLEQMLHDLSVRTQDTRGGVHGA